MDKSCIALNRNQMNRRRLSLILFLSFSQATIHLIQALAADVAAAQQWRHKLLLSL